MSFKLIKTNRLTLIADGAYSGKENQVLAESKDTEHRTDNNCTYRKRNQSNFLGLQLFIGHRKSCILSYGQCCDQDDLMVKCELVHNIGSDKNTKYVKKQ